MVLAENQHLTERMSHSAGGDLSEQVPILRGFLKIRVWLDSMGIHV
jgi:hypothetical protein